MSEVEYNEIIRPDLFFKGYSDEEFAEWISQWGADETLKDHTKSLKATIKQLEKCELYEFCAIAKGYLNALELAGDV